MYIFPTYLPTYLPNPKSEILLKFEKSKKNAFLEKGLAQILTQLEKKLKLPPHQT
jgi:hypothetical protein